MEIFESIRSHCSAMRLPLYAVTLSAVPVARTPVLLILHWHGFLRSSPVEIEGVEMPLRSVAGSAMQIDEPWDDVAVLDRAMLDAAWQTGAWDLERATHRPWWRLNAPVGETLACHHAFGDYPDAPDEDAVLAEAPDREALLELAARRGYVRWMFRPRSGGIWASVQDDDCTLEPGDVRSLPCPVAPLPFDRHRPGQWVYRFGRAARIFVSR